MGAIITDHGPPGVIDLHLKLDHEIDHYAAFGLVEVALSRIPS